MVRVIKSVTALWLVCASVGAGIAQERAQVVAVNYPLQYLAQRVMGDAGNVVFPVPEGEDPSFWRPSIADISMIQSADLIVLNGAGFATWVDRVSLPRSKLVNSTAAIEDRFITTESITHSHGDGGEHSHEGLASYTWLDPSMAIEQAGAISEAVVARGLGDAGEVEANLAALTSDFEAMDAQAGADLAGARGVAMIATHPRYEYLARRYGLSVTSLEWDAGAMPDEGQISSLRSLVEEVGAEVLIWEAEPPVAAFEITRELGLKNVVFSPLAHEVEGKSFVDAFAKGVSSLAEVANK